MAVATGSQIRPELSAVDYTPFLQASGQAAQMQAQGITSAVGGALKGFESIVQQQKENKQLDAEIKAAERFGNAIQPFLKDVNPEVQAQFGQVMGALSDPNLSARQKSTIAKGIPQALNSILGMAEIGQKAQDEKATAQYAEMLNTGGGRVPSPVSNEALAKYTPTQKLAAEERYLRQAKSKAELGQIEAQTRSITAKDAAALQKAELAKNKTLIEDAGNAMALGVAFDDSNMTPAQVRAAQVFAEGVKKTTGLDEKNNYDAYKQALDSASELPAGPERQALIIDTYLSSGGAANPDFLKKISEASKSPYQITKLGEYTVIEANGTTQIIDNKMKLADLKNIERDKYSELLSETARRYSSWVQIPIQIRQTLMQANEKYPSRQSTMFGPAPDGKAVWETYSARMWGLEDDRTPSKSTAEERELAAQAQREYDDKYNPIPLSGAAKFLEKTPLQSGASPSYDSSGAAEAVAAPPQEAMPSVPEPEFTAIPGSGGWKMMVPSSPTNLYGSLGSSNASFEPSSLPPVPTDRIALEAARSGFDRAISRENQEFTLPQIKLSRESRALAERLREQSDDYAAIAGKRAGVPRLSASENDGKSATLSGGKTITLDRDGIEAILFDPGILVELIGGKARGPSPKLLQSGQRGIGSGTAAPRLK